MKLRLTPLNIVSAVLLIGMALLLINTDENGWWELGAISLFVLFALSFIADLVFRRLIQEIKRIWLFEILFLIFTAVIIVLIRTFILKDP